MDTDEHLEKAGMVRGRARSTVPLPPARMTHAADLLVAFKDRKASRYMPVMSART
jgi:hypothetical protein